MTTPSRPNGLQVVSAFSNRHIRGQVVRGEALKFLRSLSDNYADIVFLDPPFNLGKEYSARRKLLDVQPEREYSSWLTKILFESSRILAPGEALYVYHLPVWAMQIGSLLQRDTELCFRHWIAISMKNGFVRSNRLYPAHYALLMFTKGKPKRFTRPRLLPARCRHCKKLIKDYGGYLKIIERNGGINLSDVWEDLYPVRHANTKHRKANELPMKLFERIVNMSGFPSGIFVDPFAGAGSGVIAAVGAGMEFASCDLFRSNCSLIAKRLEEYQRKLKV